MALGNLAGAGRRVLYVSGEESAAQIKLRAERLAAPRCSAGGGRDRPRDGPGDARRRRPGGLRDRLGADAVHGRARPAPPARSPRCARPRPDHAVRQGARHRRDARRPRHQGRRAGRPARLEHLVDCVLQFEGERARPYRILRAHKNRFGSTNEIGVFEMAGGGLAEVANPSALFLAEARARPAASCSPPRARGRCWSRSRRWSRRRAVPPRRTAAGVDRNRLALVLAVLGAHAGVGRAPPSLRQRRRRRAGREPGADLAVALAVASAERGVWPAR